MAEIKSFPNNQDEYVGAEHLMRWFHGRTSGVFGEDSGAAVAAVQDTMTVTVSDGLGWLSNAENDGIVWWVDAEKQTGTKLTLGLDLADGVLDRIDRVVVSWETTNYVARPQVYILKGALSSAPVPPALTNNTVKREISLARIDIAAGTLSVTPEMITDERMDPDVCGLVSESITADTSMINASVQAAIDRATVNVDQTLESLSGDAAVLIAAIEQELAEIIGGTGFDPAPIRVHDVAVLPELFAAFEAEGTEELALIEMGYPYRAAVSVANVLSSMTPYVTLSLPSVEAAGVGVLNQFRCGSGSVYLYADGIPAETITALTIECRKAVG